MPRQRDIAREMESMIAGLRGAGFRDDAIAHAARISRQTVWRAGQRMCRSPQWDKVNQISELYVRLVGELPDQRRR